MAAAPPPQRRYPPTMPPDTPLTDTAGERRALEAAVAEAWASVEAGRVTLHAKVRVELIEFIASARRRMAEIEGQAPP
jgi:hypothetical protein